MHYSIMTTAITLRRLGCAFCMPFISPFRSPFRPCNRTYAYRGLTTFAPLFMAVSGGQRQKISLAVKLLIIWTISFTLYTGTDCTRK
ncbi:MAG: hypothetical protein KZQ60_15895 [Candidatus Thiodiazotropha sp. (ex Lucinoma aequizonata)]|nr:hypothetical protein [Candidatus Thiodiazotropha sp. (ex Lucinoma aequizonata)]